MASASRRLHRAVEAFNAELKSLASGLNESVSTLKRSTDFKPCTGGADVQRATSFAVVLAMPHSPAMRPRSQGRGHGKLCGT